MEMKMEENNKFYFDLLSLESEMNYRDYSISTRRTYKRIVKEFLEVTNKDVIDVKKEDVTRFLDNKLMELSVNTILVELNALEFFFEEILGLNITENISMFSTTKAMITLARITYCKRRCFFVMKRAKSLPIRAALLFKYNTFFF